MTVYELFIKTIQKSYYTLKNEGKIEYPWPRVDSKFFLGMLVS
jgi:hypothetical protein